MLLRVIVGIRDVVVHFVVNFAEVERRIGALRIAECDRLKVLLLNRGHDRLCQRIHIQRDTGRADRHLNIVLVPVQLRL